MPVQEAATRCQKCKHYVRAIDIGDGMGWWVVPHICHGKRGGSSRHTKEPAISIEEACAIVRAERRRTKA